MGAINDLLPMNTSIKAMKVRIFVIACVLSLMTIANAVVERSIIPVMDYFHSVKNIDAKKYSKSQYATIVGAFDGKGHIIRIASYNMLFDRYDHLLAKPFRWTARLPRLVAMIQELNADILCFQELYPEQVKELIKEIEDEYDFIGKLPASNEEPFEVNGIFYRKKRFEKGDFFTHYISETPQQRSSDPFSNEPRTLIEAHLLDIASKKEIAVFCTHSAFGSADSREYAARFIARHLEPISQQKAVILAGDFNSFAPFVDDPHVPFYDGNYALKILTSKSLRDSRDAALIGTMGPISTYTNREGSILPFQGTGTPGVILDHIFVGGNLTVLTAAVQPALVDDMFASDHMPVVADCVINN